MAYLWVSNQATLKPFHFPIFFFYYFQILFFISAAMFFSSCHRFHNWPCAISFITAISNFFFSLFLTRVSLSICYFRYFRYHTEPGIASWLQPEIRWCDFVSTRFLPEKNFVSLNINTSFVSAILRSLPLLTLFTTVIFLTLMELSVIIK